ncbi:MAG: hypothetical protein ABW275_04795 [Hansschlegelia sp.]
MRGISGLLQLIGVLVIAVAGYWTWYTVWGPNPNDKIGVAIAPYMPGPFRDWGCGKLNQRFAAQSPTICSPVADNAAPPTQGSTEGSGKL